MRSEINVALAQLNPVLHDTAENVRIVREVVAEHGDADLVVFPELFSRTRPRRVYQLGHLRRPPWGHGGLLP